MSLGPHASFIIMSYVVTAIVIGALIAWVVSDHAAQRRILGDLEASGVRRRSQGKHEVNV